MRTKTSLKIMTGSAPLVPLVSLFFILLVFFMISNSLVFWPGTKVETSLRLPKARISSLSEADKLVVTITRSGQLFFEARFFFAGAGGSVSSRAGAFGAAAFFAGVTPGRGAS